MRRVILNTWMVFCCMLIGVGVPSVISPVGAQRELIVTEAEPNDIKERAQQVPLSIGMTTTIRGRAAREDRGSYVDELDFLFSLDDDIEDWYVIEVQNPTELSIQMSWPEEADMDAWIFTDISKHVLFDGLTLHAHAATNANPERLLNRLLYTYSTRDDETQGLLQPLPRSSRYYLAISNYDPADWSGPATYELKLTVSGPGSLRREENQFVRYDNNGYGRFTAIDPDELDAERLLVLERITPAEYPATLDAINLFQFSGPVSSRRQDMLVLVDPTGSGDPSRAREVFRRKVRIPSVEETSLISYFISGPGLTILSGDLYVGFELVNPTEGQHIPFDVDKAGFRRSFISTDGGRTYGRMMIASDQSRLPFIANSGITADLMMGAAAPAARSREQVSIKVEPATIRRYDGGVSVVK
ncbi:MAG: hypothetical protein RMM98_14085 [Acidobacteriota bacterium]|nr:hypothetical protein [Blastocatellia bacterium]MDW8240735.1 hypothetical protein [Acidobacteriota bacterium]